MDVYTDREMARENLGNLIIVNSENFNPIHIKEMLGLVEGVRATKLPVSEKKRLANMLKREGKISDEEVAKLGMIIKKNDS